MVRKNIGNTVRYACVLQIEIFLCTDRLATRDLCYVSLPTFSPVGHDFGRENPILAESHKRDWIRLRIRLFQVKDHIVICTSLRDLRPRQSQLRKARGVGVGGRTQT
jgi:hypothetical protein